MSETSSQNINKTNFSNLNVSGASTLLLSLNVWGPTNLNNVNIPGNLNVYGTTTVIYTNKPNLSGYITSTDLNKLSTYSALNISNLQATSTTIFNKTNFISLSVVGLIHYQENEKSNIFKSFFKYIKHNIFEIW